MVLDNFHRAPRGARRDTVQLFVFLQIIFVFSLVKEDVVVHCLEAWEEGCVILVDQMSSSEDKVFEHKKLVRVVLSSLSQRLDHIIFGVTVQL